MTFCNLCGVTSPHSTVLRSLFSHNQPTLPTVLPAIRVIAARQESTSISWVLAITLRPNINLRSVCTQDILSNHNIFMLQRSSITIHRIGRFNRAACPKSKNGKGKSPTFSSFPKKIVKSFLGYIQEWQLVDVRSSFPVENTHLSRVPRVF